MSIIFKIFKSKIPHLDRTGEKSLKFGRQDKSTDIRLISMISPISVHIPLYPPDFFLLAPRAKLSRILEHSSPNFRNFRLQRNMYSSPSKKKEYSSMEFLAQGFELRRNFLIYSKNM
uniref:Uncharacterized protein n=1 Tax=Meloidogyne enterolobii TaxID=390850 RepID=A0A6V7U040_MELEN|nr:unnamed protein product [Meloidogyne enterolobii]